jgi:hypothetical protein
MMNSDIYSTVMTGQNLFRSATTPVRVINRLQVNLAALSSTTSWSRLATSGSSRSTSSPPTMGAIAERSSQRDDPGAFARAAADRSYVIVAIDRRLDRGRGLVGGRHPRGQRPQAGAHGAQAMGSRQEAPARRRLSRG